jgi:hypothetical protein
VRRCVCVCVCVCVRARRRCTHSEVQRREAFCVPCARARPSLQQPRRQRLVAQRRRHVQRRALHVVNRVKVHLRARRRHARQHAR